MVHDFSPIVVGLRIAATLTILSLCAGCNPSPPLVVSPPPPTTRPAVTPRAVTPAPTLTPHAVVPRAVALAVPTERVADRAAVLPSVTPLNVQPTTACCDAPTEAIIGASVGGRPLTVWQFAPPVAGSSGAPRALLLVGGMHGGYEANTITLMHQLIDYFGAHPDAIPASVRLLVVPAANPDGAAGVGLDARFNGHGVDLNRNWGCGWSSAAYWRDQQVNPGAAAFSEPETQALASFIRQQRPAAALFFHSAANGVFAGDCDGDHGSAALAAAFGSAAAYPYESAFSAYPVTGTAASWADGEGIPAADVELTTHGDSEFDRNLRGVLAIMAWIAAQAA